MEIKEVYKKWYELVQSEASKITFDRDFGVPISEYNKQDFCRHISLYLDSFIGKTVYFDIDKDGIDEEYILLRHEIKKSSDGKYNVSLKLQPLEYDIEIDLNLEEK